MQRLKGQSALITGASAGIGRAVAFALAREGADIIATGRREKELKAVADECRALGVDARYLVGDLNSEGFISKLGEAAANVDILVNNAGILNYGPLLDFSPADSKAMFDTNVLASLRVAQVVGANMVKRKRGHMIIITSGAGRQVPKMAVVYSATKHALAAITKGLRMELQPYGIKVSEVSPGMVDTDIRAPITHPDVLAALKARTYSPLTTEEVAAAVVFAATAPPNVLTEIIDVRPVVGRLSQDRMESAMLEKSKQKFVISHYSENDYKSGGLRAAAEYRDLGVAEATNGMFTAHVARLAPGALKDKEPSRMHYHDINFHMIYVLKGWMRAEFEGEGVHTMRAGSCWVQPPGIRHKVLAQSEDMELIEIISPAQFDTVNVD